MTKGYDKFMRLYRTELIKGEKGVVVASPVRVEVFGNERSYLVAPEISPYLLHTSDAPTIEVSDADKAGFSPEDKPREIVFGGKYTHIEITAQVKDNDVSSARNFCENNINRTVATLSAILSPNLFSDQVWEGWVAGHGRVVVDGWRKPVKPVVFDADALTKSFLSFRRHLATDSNLNKRFTLMAKLFARATSLRPGEEKFLWLWLVLEVFPMEDTSDIAPISNLLAVITGRSAKDLKEKLQIGLLFRARSDLVHDGTLNHSRVDFGAVITRLDHIVLTIIRHTGGLSYDGLLGRYL
jgi:hypothetical protein